MTTAPISTIERTCERETLRNERGFVLVTVLFVLSFLALAAVTVSRALQTNLALTRNAIANAQAEAFSEAGIALAMLDLAGGADGESQQRIPHDGTPFACVLPQGAELQITLSDEAGRIDLNQASEALLTALLAGLGLDADTAGARAAAIADFRDADNDRRAGGAERSAYEAAGRAGPKNAPFDSVRELKSVAGFDAALAERAMPFLTVHSAQDGVDAALAARGLLPILQRGGSAMPAEDDVAISGATADDSLPAGFRVVSARRAFSITSRAVTANGARFDRGAVAGVRRARGSRTRVAAPASPASEFDSIPARLPPRDGFAEQDERFEAFLYDWHAAPPRHGEVRSKAGVKSLPAC